jgi:hypothetical protein
MTLGPAAGMKLEAARVRAGGILAAVRAGRDPAGEKSEARARAGDTFEPMVRRYLAHQRARLRQRSYTAAETYLLNHWKPLHGLSVARISEQDAARLLRQHGPCRVGRQAGTRDAFRCRLLAPARIRA